MTRDFHLDLTSGWAAVAGAVAFIVVFIAVKCLLFHGNRRGE